MRRSERTFSILTGGLLCLLTLAGCVIMQRWGYLGYLDSDIAAEILLAKRQVETHSFIQMDWLYSTEIRILAPNLLYALALEMGAGLSEARIIGNTLGLMLAMGTCVFLGRKAKLSWGAVLCAAAALPVSASALYAYAVTIGGFYIFHLIFGFLAAALWLGACRERPGRRWYGLFLAVCALEGLLSVRYVLCFICPMMAVEAMLLLMARSVEAVSARERRTLVLTLLGFLACLLGYAVSEVLMPKLFMSGVGAASSFHFGELDVNRILQTLLQVIRDFMVLMGFRGGVALFSLPGMVNLCIVGSMVLFPMAAVRVWRALSVEKGEAGIQQRRLMRLALATMAANLFCFLFLEGAYLNRYLILALFLCVPVAAIVLVRERNAVLRAALALMLTVGLAGGQVLSLQEAKTRSEQAQADQLSLMRAAGFLQENGYTHGYGTFWNVRLLEERTEGKLTFTAIYQEQNEEGAVCAVSPALLRWLEPSGASDMDISEGNKSFLLLSSGELEAFSEWISFAKAPCVYNNDGFAVYDFDSSEAFVNAMLMGRMKLENARMQDGYVLSRGGRMRVPTSWREAGVYTVAFRCSGQPAQDSALRIYTGSGFDVLAESAVVEGENALTFELPADDKYFMLLLTAGDAQELHITDLQIRKAEE